MISTLDLQNNVLKVLINLLDFQTFLLFTNYYFFKKTNSNGIKEIITFILFSSISIFAPSKLEYPLQLVIEFLFLYIFYKRSIKKCIIASVFFQMFYWGSFYAISLLVIIYRVIMTNYSMNITNPLFEVIVCSLISYTSLSFYILYKTNQRCFKGSHFSLSYLSISFLEIVLLMHLNRIMSNYSEFFNTLFMIYIIIVLLEVVNVTLYSKMITSTNNQMIQQVEIEKYKLESDYTKQIDDSFRQVSKVRHDFKNQLIVLHSYAEQNRTDDLIQYIEKIQDMISTTKVFNTPNSLVSSILNSKNMICENNNIKFNVNCFFEYIHIGDYEIMTMLGNIIDNAITATSALPDGYINFSIIQLDSYIEIKCENNHKEKINESHGLFKTTKKDTTSLHGLGISNIKDVVNSLNGTADFQYDDSTFTVKILIPNY